MKIFKNIFLFLSGIIVAIFLLIVALYGAINIIAKSNVNYILLLVLELFILLAVVFWLWRKKRPIAAGMIFCFVMSAAWGTFIFNKGYYEHQTFEARRFPNRVGLRSKPPKAQFIHMDTNSEMVDIAGAYELYYRKEEKIIATHPDFPDVQLKGEIKPDTYDLTFDFHSKRVTDLQPPFLMKYIK